MELPVIIVAQPLACSAAAHVVSLAGMPESELHHITPGPQNPVRFGSLPKSSPAREGVQTGAAE